MKDKIGNVDTGFIFRKVAFRNLKLPKFGIALKNR